jgi:hypothetical protein
VIYQDGKLRTANRSKLVLTNADAFSCDWRDRSVAVNYRKAGDAEGNLVTLEAGQRECRG